MIRWIPVTERLPDKTKEASDKNYLVTTTETWADGSSLHVFAIEWGMASEHADSIKEDRPYIWDGWCFGQIWDDRVDVAEHVIAWMEFPEPYVAKYSRRTD